MRCLLVVMQTLCVLCVSVAQELVESGLHRDHLRSGNITIMTWNILAPIWVDKAALKKDGIDLNLLDASTRLAIITREILNRRPDVLALQEVQEDVFEYLSSGLSSLYAPVAFAPNKKEYWKAYLPIGMQYMRNGVATFVKRLTVGVESHQTFPTSTYGSVALTSILYTKLPRLSGHGSERGRKKFIVINAHHESGFTAADSAVRVRQGTVIMREADRVQAEVSRNSGSRPFLIITGDFNSQRPYPCFMNYNDSGFLDALEALGDSEKQTYLYAKPVELPSGAGFVTGATIDHVFIRTLDAEEGRDQFLAASVPDISSSYLSEDSYAERLRNITIENIKQNRLEQVQGMLDTLIGISNDDLDFDSAVNRALRLGSDHLPLTVDIRYAM